MRSLSVLIILLVAAALTAMPPHPDVIDQYRKQGRLPELTSSLQAMKAKGMDSPERSFPTTGTRKVLVILINYSDTTFDESDTDTFYDSLFEIGSYSWRQYYLDMSNNKLDLSFDVYGPYTASGDHDYYGSNVSGTGTDANPAELVLEAINLADDAVNFSDYDNDGDDYVDSVIVIHQGT